MSDTKPPEHTTARQPSGVTVNEIYKEQYAHFRGMNDTLYKIPPLFTAVIGGLWYFAVQNITEKPAIASAVFAFTAIAAVCFVNVMSRFRQAFNGYISNLNKLDGEMKVTTKGGKFRVSTITTIQVLLWIAFLVSASGVFYPFYKV
jgi:hypothetical protein